MLTKRALTILRMLLAETNGLALKQVEDRLGPGTYAAMGYCYAHGLVNCTSLPGDRQQDVKRTGAGETLPARAAYRTFTITKLGAMKVKDASRALRDAA